MRTLTNLLTQSAKPRGRWSGYLNHGAAHLMMSSLGRFTTVRSFMSWAYQQKALPSPLGFGPSMVEQVDFVEAFHRIRQDGIYPGLRLRQEVVKEFLSFCSTATCFGEGKAEFPFRYADRESAEHRAGQRFRRGVFNNALRASHLLQGLMCDPQLLAIAGSYLETVPVPIQARIWWSFAGQASGEEQRLAGQAFHYDIDSYRGLTFFFYLTDVSPRSGAHVYVRGTHAKKAWKDTFRIYKRRTDDEIAKTYGVERQRVLSGTPGYGFAEDIFGFHKGLHPQSGDRLMIQVGFGLRDYWNFNSSLATGSADA